MWLRKLIKILVFIIIFGLILNALSSLITGKNIITFTKHWLASVTKLILVISPPSCGNNIHEPGEECDGSDLSGQTCLNLGFAGGTLSCNPDCTFNTSNCTTVLPPAAIPPIVPGPIVEKEVPPKKIPPPEIPKEIPKEKVPPEKIFKIPPPIVEIPPKDIVIEWETGGALDVVIGISGLVSWSASALTPIAPGPPELPQTTDETPTFKGISSIPFALIFLELSSPVLITGQTQADEAGYWTWTSPQPLSLGIHILKITAQDPKDPSRKIISSQKFEVVSKEYVKKIEKTLFSVSLTIQPKYKKVYPGDDLLVLVEITKPEPGGKIDISLHYQIRDEKEKVILDYIETMAIETRLSFLKTFHITDAAKLGKYKIFLEIPYNNTFVHASDSFEIIKRPLFVIPGVITITLTKKEILRSLGLIFGTFLILVILVIFVIFLYRQFIFARKIKKISPIEFGERRFTKEDEEERKVI